MRQWAGDENSLLLVENNESHRTCLKRVQQDLQDSKKLRVIRDEWEYYFPFQHIREDPLFRGMARRHPRPHRQSSGTQARRIDAVELGRPPGRNGALRGMTTQLNKIYTVKTIVSVSQ
jgi:hypothetical protein